MVKLHKKIIDLLRQHLDEVQDALDNLPGGRVAGVVVSPSFRSMNHQAPQRKLIEILKGQLTADELSAVGAIAALTPAEASVKAS